MSSVPSVSVAAPAGSALLFKGNSSRLELLIEKIQANKENHHVSERELRDALGTDPGSSWRSDTPDDQTSRSPSSCATPNSATDVPDAELTFTVGVTEGTPYACQFCERAFPRLSYLKKHEQTHSDQMPFRCDFCSRLFKHKRSRDRHIKLHTGDKKYRCAHCDAAFSRSDHLKIHMKTHDTQKPFQCAVCNRGYNTAAALTSHMQSHKKESGGVGGAGGGVGGGGSGGSSAHSSPSPAGFRCLLCGAAFRRAEELQAHAVSQHAAAAPPGPLDGLLHGLGLGIGLLPALPKLACIYCTKDSFTSMEALQLHVQAMHRAILNGDVRAPGVALETTPRLTPPRRTPPQPASHVTSHAAALAVPHARDARALSGPSGGSGREGLSTSACGTTSATANATATATSSALACDLCTMRFSSPHALQRHVHSVHALEPGARVCGDCALPVSSAAQLAEHRARAHAEQLRPTDLSKKAAPTPATAPTNAALDAASAPDAKRARAADASPHDLPAGTLLCNQCGAALPDFESFRAHLKSHLEEAAGDSPGGVSPGGGSGGAAVAAAEAAAAASPAGHACPHCGTAFDDAGACEAHVMGHFLATATEFGCPSCMKLYAQPDELQKHLMDMHAHHLYRCALCRDVFDSKVAIQVHFAVKHSSQCTLFRCTACPPAAASVFRSQLDFELHVRATHAPPPPPLALAASAAGLPPVSQPFRCLFCRLSFGTELEMQLHLAAHSKQFRCPLCQEAFHVEFLLDKHLSAAHSQVLSNGARSPPAAAAAAAPDAALKGGSERGGGSAGSGASERGDADEAPPAGRKSASSGGSSNKAVSSGGGGAVSLHCAYCSENCKSRTELENHMKTHSAGAGGGGKHKCNICDELCPSAAVLAEHKLTHCKVVAGSACTQCKAALLSEEQFFSHLQQHATSGCGGGGGGGSPAQGAPLPAPCVVCRQTLLSDMEARLHARFHLQRAGAEVAGTNPAQCCVCLQPCALPSGDGRAALCRDCAHGERAHSPPPPQPPAVPLPNHAPNAPATSAAPPPATDRDAKTYQCIKCQVSFDSEPEIQRHVASHVLSEGASLECRLCRRVLASPLKLQAHLIEHTFAGCGAFTCYLCSAVFTAAAGLQAHMLQHGLHARPYDCSRCALRFFFRAELEHHSYSHVEHDAQQHAADFAGKVALYQQQQQQHPAAANGAVDGVFLKVEEPLSPGSSGGKRSTARGRGRAFSCPDCGKTCSHARALASHQQRHHTRLASVSPPPPAPPRVKEEPASADEAFADVGAEPQSPPSSPAASAALSTASDAADIPTVAAAASPPPV